jgi:hypothetical protein
VVSAMESLSELLNFHLPSLRVLKAPDYEYFVE